MAGDMKTLAAPTDRAAFSWRTAAAVLAAGAGAVLVLVLAWFPVLGVGDRHADLSAIKTVPRPVEFATFDHLTYMSIARNVQEGASAFVEPFTGTGTSIYPSGYYWLIGTLSRLLDTDVPTVWNVLGMLTALGLVAMSAAWALWGARGTRAYALAAVPLVVGTLAWWVGDGAWLGLYRHLAVVLWAPWAILAMGTAESASLLLLGLALLATAAMLVAKGRRRLALALVAGLLVGVLFHFQAYVAIFATVVLLATLVVEDLLKRPSLRWAIGAVASTLIVLFLFGTDAIDVEATTKIGLFIVFVAVMLIARPGWLGRMWAPGLALAAPALVVAAPVLIRLLVEAGGEDSFFFARQRQNEGRDLTLPISSVIVHELPVVVLGVAAAVGLWRTRRTDPRRTPWLATLLSLLIVTPLLTYNHAWGVDQEPYRFLPYGVLFVCVLGVPWLWLAFTRGDVAARASAGVAALLLAATIPTTVAHTRAVDAAGVLQTPPEVTSAYERISDATGGELTLVDTCFSPEFTRVLGGPNDVQYHPGVAYPDHVEQLNHIRASLRRLVLPPRTELSAAGIRWFATHTNCGGIDPAEIRRSLGTPTASFPMPAPEQFWNPLGTRYEVYAVS